MFFSKNSYAGGHPAPVTPSATPSGLSQVKQALRSVEKMRVLVVTHETHRSKPICATASSIQRRYLQLASATNPPISISSRFARKHPQHSQRRGVGAPNQVTEIGTKERRHNHTDRTTARRHNHIPPLSDIHYGRERTEHLPAEILKLRRLHPTIQRPIQHNPQQAMPLDEQPPIPAVCRLPINLCQAVTLFRMLVKIGHHDRIGVELAPPLHDGRTEA